jgi:hypothetical protein
MQSRRTVSPGQKGTKKLLEQYGGQLVCVRYRYDAQREISIKTVEIIVAEAKYKPRPRRIPDDQLVGLRIGFREVELQRRIRQAGGKWNAADRLWEIRYNQVVKLDLTERIEKKKVSNTGNKKGLGAALLGRLEFEPVFSAI